MEEKRYRETILLSPDGPEWAFHASVLDGQAWPEAESIIATDAWWAFEYAQDVVGSGNATIERGIMNDGTTHTCTLVFVKGRFEPRRGRLARSTCKSVLCAKGPCSSICQGRGSCSLRNSPLEYLLLLQVRRLSTGTGVKRLVARNSSSTVGAGDQ